MQGWARTLTNSLIHFSSTHSSSPADYQSVDITWSTGSVAPTPDQLQAAILGSIAENIREQADWLYFEEHALPICTDWFAKAAGQSMSLCERGESYDQHFAVVLPYFCMQCKLHIAALHLAACQACHLWAPCQQLSVAQLCTGDVLLRSGACPSILTCIHYRYFNDVKCTHEQN